MFTNTGIVHISRLFEGLNLGRQASLMNMISLYLKQLRRKLFVSDRSGADRLKQNGLK